MEQTNTELIKVTDAVKKFKEVCVLDHVDITFMSGEITGIVGRNGSGKTVLLKCIIGLYPLTEGSIRVSGKEIGKDADFASDTGFIIESPGFLSNVSGYRNLRYLASINRKIGDETVRDVIRKVGLDPDSKKHVGNYSMGMKQRLGIAQALMEDPKILIFDEPMNGLDNEGVREMRQLFVRLAKEEGKTILVTSHNHEDIESMCSVVYEMDHGRIISRVVR